MEEDTDDKGETVRKACTLALLTLRRLERLAKRKTHGTTAASIMTNFVEAGLREAIKEGYIRLEDDE